LVAAEGHYSHAADQESFNNPQKWFVRYRWLIHAKRRAKKNGRGTLKLLTLPGVECFDVRLLYDNNLLDVSPTGFKNCVAYCEINYERFARIGNLLPNALRLHDSYENTIGVGRLGFSSRADRWFPFDIINLDFTGPGFRQPGKDASTTAEAILKTFRLQKIKRCSFSLFLTLPADPRNDTYQGKQELATCLNENLAAEQTQEFTQLFRSKYPLYNRNSPHPYDTINYHDFLLVTVPKIIIKFGIDEWFQVCCEEKMTYVGEGHQTRMVSFCFTCEYIGRPPGYGGTPRTEDMNYPSDIARMIRKKVIDINQLFESNTQLYQKYSRIRDAARAVFGKKILEIT
jgi:hypothetical protein